MDDFSKLVSTLIPLLWSIGAGIVLWRLFPILTKILESRSFTLKIAGQELTVQSTAEQFSAQIADLQNQVIELRKLVAASDAPMVPADATFAQHQPIPSISMLWVDDNPENNAWEVDQLQRRGIEVVIAKSTEEGLYIAENRPGIRVIVSDMGRVEGGKSNSNAGIDLLKQLRGRGSVQPFLIYTTGHRAKQHAADIKAAGGDGATASPVELVEWVARNAA